MGNFQWTDELVMEFAYSFVEENKNRFGSKIEAFKESKLPKPEWEILSFGTPKSLLYNLTPEGLYSCRELNGGRPYKYFFEMDIPIHSVKRLSDGEVFTIGDEVEWNLIEREGERKIKIESFQINTIIQQHRMFINNQNCCIEYLKKITQPKPLFTTEDGVDIFKGDRYFYLSHSIAANGFTPYECTYAEYSKDRDSDWKYFSTKEAAEQYIIENKPCLSLNDVVNSSLYNKETTKTIHPFLYLHIEILKKLVKLKLNP